MARRSRRNRQRSAGTPSSPTPSYRKRQNAWRSPTLWQRVGLIALLLLLAIGGFLLSSRAWQRPHHAPVQYSSSEVQARAASGNRIADAIANGHAFDKHLLEEGEWAGLGINTRQQFAEFLKGIIEHPSEKRSLSNGRIAYWDNATGTVVIYNPGAPDLGTAFQPDNGIRYFYNLR